MKSITTLGLAIVLGLSACAHQALAPVPITIAILGYDGGPVASLDAVATPYTQGGPSATAMLPQDTTARTAEGLAVSAITIRAWRERSGVRVQVYALVPSEGSPNAHTSTMSDLRESEIGSYHLESGQTQPIREMEAFGVKPFALRCISA